MDTQSFLRRIVPADGIKWVVEYRPNTKHPKGGVFIHHPFVDHDDMTDCINQLEVKGRTVYFACASYNEVRYKTVTTHQGDFTFPVGRTQDNVKQVQALWQDFDVGKHEGDGALKSISYATRDDALVAIKRLMVEVGLPRPLLVSSGNGFHAYWTFTEPVACGAWVKLAQMVRTVYTHLKIKFDTSRDMDPASILRPIGTTNGGKPVRIVRDGDPTPYHDLLSLFGAYIETHNLELLAPIPTARAPVENMFGGGPTEFPDASLALAADRCAQIANFRDTGGETEPVWYANLGVAKHCTIDGEALAHEWSRSYSGYDQAETQRKLDQWAYGPTTCEKYRQLNPSLCDACAFKGKVKSPIQLGVPVDVKPPMVVAETDEGEVKFTPPNWPRSFVHKNGVVSMLIPDGDGVPQSVRVFEPLFYLSERIRLEDNTYGLKVRMNVRGSEWREFDLPQKSLAETRALKATLAGYEIMTYNDKLLDAYVKDYATALRRHTDVVNTFKQFGWNKDRTGFIIGDEMIHSTGRSKVRISRERIKDDDLVEACHVRGSKTEWTEAVMTLYGAPEAVHYQYALLTQLAAPLAPLLEREEWNGIPLALTSDGSGWGKTTVVKIGINALCNSGKVTLSSYTTRSVINRSGQMNHVPVLFDEMTKQITDPEQLAEIAYDLSNGRGRVGMQSDGMERAQPLKFKLMSTITANKNFFELLAQSKTTPIATQMRIFEIAMESYPRIQACEEEASKRYDKTLIAKHHQVANHVVDNVHGVWANDYIGFIIKNKEEVVSRLNKTVVAIIGALGGNAAQERFFAYHLACVLIAGWIGKRLGMHAFDMNHIRDWGFAHITRMRGVANHYGAYVEDQFSKMLTDMHGTILVTRNYDSLDARRGKIEMPMLQIRGGVQARLVLGSDDERGKLLVAVTAVDEWCAKNGVTPSAFKRKLAAKGFIRMGVERGRGMDRKASLGRGVPSHPTARCRCLEFEYFAVQGYIEDHVRTDNVVDFPTKPPTGDLVHEIGTA